MDNLQDARSSMYNSILMTHEQLIAAATQWFWNEFPEDRRMLYAIDNNSSNSFEGNKKKALGVVKGVFDLCYITYDGRSVYLDGKVGNDRLSKEQEDFADKLNDRRVAWFTFSSLEEFKEIINMIQNG